MRHDLKHRFAFLLALALAIPSLAAGDGVGELALDRTAVATLIRYSTPSRIEARLPAFGEVSAALGPPRDVRLVDGGIEAVVPLAVERPALSIELDARFVPVVDREAGTIRLVADRVVPLGASLPGLDVKGLVPPVELPRTLGGEVLAPGGDTVRLSAFVQGVRVTDERLIVEFGLVATPAGEAP